MKKVRLKELTLTNFKGIEAFKLSLNGAPVTSVYGDNRTGKTTLFDAFCFLCFSKDSLGSADFAIKTLNNDGEAHHGVNHQVEGIIDLGDRELTLKKVYLEKWTKKRGQAKAEFTGHQVDHFIDGVPVKKGEYDEVVNSICKEDLFRLLTNPRYFNESLHWQKRRSLLLEVCGDITDEDVIKSNRDLADLPGILGKRTTEEHKKVLAGRRVEINRELSDIPVRIDEVKGREVKGLESKKAVETKLKAAESKRDELAAQLQQIENGGEVPVFQKELNVIEAEIGKLDNDFAKRQAAVNETHRAGVSSLQATANKAGDALDAAARSKRNLIASQVDIKAQFERATKQADELRAEWEKTDEMALILEVEDICPTCGQMLPTEKVEAAKAKATEDFNQRKAKKLADITMEGKGVTARADGYQAQVAKLATEIANIDAEIQRLTGEHAAAIKAVDDFKATAHKPAEEDPQRRILESRKKTLNEQIEAAKAGASGDTLKIREDIAACNYSIEGLKGILLQIEANTRIEARIKELSDQEKNLSADFERVEKELFLIEEFIRTKVSMLDEKINSKFSTVRFKLFEQQINEGVKETCEATINGVPYSSANNASKINAGIEITNILSEHYGIAVVTFCDNAESVTEMLPSVGQQIRLIVSAEDKTLRVVEGQ